MKKWILLALVPALALMPVLCACAAKAPLAAGATLEPAPTPTPAPETTQAAGGALEISFERLPLVRREQTYGSGNALIYPAVDAEEFDALNAAILKRILAGLNRMTAPVYTYFNIKCNEDGILSILVSYYDMETRELYLKLPMTFDAATGKEITLAECFRAEDDAWRSVIPDIVTDQANSTGMVLLSDILPIGDEQLFYLTGSSLVILYRPYEITTCLSGWPEFGIGYDRLSAYFSEDAAIARLFRKV